MIAEILSEVSKIGTVKIDEESENAVETLSDRILKQIYGQDEAVRLVSEAIQMSKAGLSDEGKPLASLLPVHG
jgi:ATP-dependent Clp protease ATP-binding subunit ClpA